MRTAARRLLAVLAAAGSAALLGACSDDTTAEQPVSPPTAVSPADSVPAAGGERVPLGLEIRYLDANGKVVILEPKDFPR